MEELFHAATTEKTTSVRANQYGSPPSSSRGRGASGTLLYAAGAMRDAPLSPRGSPPGHEEEGTGLFLPAWPRSLLMTDGSL